jgi:hypothetical protein
MPLQASPKPTEQTASPVPYIFDCTPVPDGDGFDGDVTSIQFNTTDVFAFDGAPGQASPSNSEFS